MSAQKNQIIAQKKAEPSLLDLITSLKGKADSYAAYKGLQYIRQFIDLVPYNTLPAYGVATGLEQIFGDELEDLGFGNVEEDGICDEAAKVELAQIKPHISSERFIEYTDFLKTKMASHMTYCDTVDERVASKGVLEKDWNIVKAYLDTEIESLRNAEKPVELINLLRFASFMGCTDVEKEVLEFLYIARHFTPLATIFSDLEKHKNTVIALCLGKPADVKAVSKLLSSNSKFVERNIVIPHKAEADSYYFFPSINFAILSELDIEDISDDGLKEKVLGKSTNAEFTVDHYEYLGPPFQDFITQLKYAIEHKEEGVNALLYGPPGVGKTELAKAVIAHLGVEGYLVGEGIPKFLDSVFIFDEEGDVIDFHKESDEAAKRRKRHMEHLEELLEEGIIVKDEIEDELLKGADSGKKPDAESKLDQNRSVEKNRLPTICIANDVDKFHESFLQRFSVVLRITGVPTLVRKRMWDYHLDKHKVQLPEKEVLELVRQYNPAPRQISHAVSAVKRLAVDGKLDINALKRNLASSSVATKQTSSAIREAAAISPNFSPDLLSGHVKSFPNYNVRQSLEEIASIGKKGIPYSLLIKGDETAGIEDTVRYLSEKMLLEPLEYTAMEMIAPAGPLAPPPEVRIAGAFNAATDNRYCLIVPGIDQIVGEYGRPDSDASWGNNHLVNLFIEQARNHNLPFIATMTNPDVKLPKSFEDLFTIHMCLKNYSPDQSVIAFKHYFGIDAEAEDFLRDPDQAFGQQHFVNVAARLLKEVTEPTKDRILEMLKLERSSLNAATSFGFPTGFQTRKNAL